MTFSALPTNHSARPRPVDVERQVGERPSPEVHQLIWRHPPTAVKHTRTLPANRTPVRMRERRLLADFLAGGEHRPGGTHHRLLAPHQASSLCVL